MRNLHLALLVVSTLGAAAMPASAASGKAINFTYRDKEMVTEQGRSALLDRMKVMTRAACRGSRSNAYRTPGQCRVDLERQFIGAIGNPVLIAQYQGELAQIARNGS